jgi:hypothetical protein
MVDHMRTRTKVAVGGGLALALLTPGLFGGADAIATSLAVPSLSTAVVSSSVVVDSQISDSATLSGGTAPTGKITFSVYGPADPTCQTALTTSTATVTGAGTYQSAAFAANTVGTYRWIAPAGRLSPMTPATVAAGNIPAAIALSVDGKHAYVTNLNDKHGLAVRDRGGIDRGHCRRLIRSGVARLKWEFVGGL